MKAPSAKFAYFLTNKKLKFNRNKEGQIYHKPLLKQHTCGLSPRMRKNFNWLAMKGEAARENQLKFSMRGGLLFALLMRAPSAKFVYFLPKQKVKKDFCKKQLLLGKNKLSLRAKSNKVPLKVKEF